MVCPSSLNMTKILFVFLFLLLVFWIISPPNVIAQEKIRNFDDKALSNFKKILKEIEERGSTRVIIELETDFQPEGKLSSISKVNVQRENIKKVQNKLMDSFPDISKLSHKFKYSPFVALTVTNDSLEKLYNSPLVKQVHPNGIKRATLADSIPLIGADIAFDAGFDGTGKTLAILDTGVDSSHSFFSGRIVSEACYSVKCPNNLPEQVGPGAAVPCPSLALGCDHGTHVTGIAAGSGETFSGVAKNSDIIAIQVFSVVNNFFFCFPSPTPCLVAFDEDIMKGLERVFELRNDFDIAAANLSLGGGLFSTNCDNDSLKPSIDQLHSVGIATVIASGNDFSSTKISSPACISTAISVGSTTKTDQVSTFSNSAGILDLLATGESINSSTPGDNFEVFSGTSMATPHVTGLWAVIKQQNPPATVDEVLSLLTSTGKPILDLRNGLTKPRIQVDAALGLSTSTSPPGKVTDLSLTVVSGTQVDLTWSIPDDGGSSITGYLIQSRVNGMASTIETSFGDATTNSYSDTTLTAGDRVVYRIAAINANGQGPFSNVPPLVTTGGGGGVGSVPDKVTDLSLTVVSGTQVDLTWSIPDDGGSSITGYLIQKRTIGTGLVTLETSFGDATTNSYSDTTLTAGDRVVYRIAAINANGQGPFSNVPPLVMTS